jgi:hypothetical protein
MTVPQQNSRERSDSYRGEVLRSGDWRVAVCRDGLQWLLQHRRERAKEDATAAWDSVAFCTTRAALVRLWRAHTGQDGADLLGVLPERIARPRRSRYSSPRPAVSVDCLEMSHGR